MVRVMVYNATFNNISAISWLSILLVEETGVPREDYGTCRTKGVKIIPRGHMSLYRSPGEEEPLPFVAHVNSI